MNIKKLKNKGKRSRRAVSEVMGAVIMLGVTVGVGFGAWAWITGAARGAENNLNGSATENFVVINANFTSRNNIVTLMLYNPSPASVYITNVVITNGSWTQTAPTPIAMTWTNGTSAMLAASRCPLRNMPCALLRGQANTLINMNLGTSPTMGSSYTFKVIGEYGTDIQYQQVR